jgi:hypothetical protein
VADTTTGPDLGESLARALQKDRPMTMADREADPAYVRVVLNPGSHSSIGQRRFGPGDTILVDEAHAERLTAITEYRPYAAARFVDEPEPDTGGNWSQPHGAGRFHPDSQHHTAPESEPVEPAEGQTTNADGELSEGLRARRAAGQDQAEGEDAGRHSARDRAANANPVGDGGKGQQPDERSSGQRQAQGKSGKG